MNKKSLMTFCRLLGIFLLPLFFMERISCESWNFSNRNIKEILFSISTYTGIPIAADDTVNGTADFYFSGGDFGVAFDSFLKANRLFVSKSPDLWMVSRISLLQNGNLFSLDACDVPPGVLFEKLGIALGCGISFEGLESQPLTIHKSFSTSDEIVRFIARQISDCVVSEQDGSFHVAKVLKASGRGTSKAFIFKTGDDLYNADVKGALFSDAIDSLFKMAEKQFCLLGNGNEKIERLSVLGQSFEDVLKLLCAQGNCEAILKDGVWYIVPSKTSQSHLVHGEREWVFFELRFTEVSKIVTSLKTRFFNPEILVMPDDKNFFVLLKKNEVDEVQNFIKLFDVAQKSQMVNLKYITVSDFIAHLPPSVHKENIVDTGTGNSFFFTGSDSLYQKLLSELPLSDKPVQRICYDILIMQYENTSSSYWESTLGAQKLSLGDMNSMTAQLGSVLSFNLDVVSAFGLKFASQMQTSIQENKAHVFADTTLHGVSGATINFQNTNTYRYRDNNLDPETGKPVYSGVTREIISGLKLDIQGWVSGDGMITSKVTASVSRQGTDVSSTTGNPPPTSEKVITTEVRSKSGEPVVLSGLVQSAETESTERTPFLSKIPILGLLFKGENKTKEQSDIVIYLVPHWENDGEAEVSLLTRSAGGAKSRNTELDFKNMNRLFNMFILPEITELEDGK